MCSLLLQDIVIQQDDEIRLKIVGTRVDKNDIVNDLFIVFTFSIRTIYFSELSLICTCRVLREWGGGHLNFVGCTHTIILIDNDLVDKMSCKETTESALSSNYADYAE